MMLTHLTNQYQRLVSGIKKPYPKNFKARDLYQMLIAASEKLETYVDLINDINVFPVPDGDTGINMRKTFCAIITEVTKSKLSNHCGEIISAAAKGAFLGCGGNSGIILTEYFHGLEMIWKDYKTIDKSLFTKGLVMGAKVAYQAVETPKEGTILTVGRLIAETAQEYVKNVDNPYELLLLVFEKARNTLLDTHLLLPEAKKAGVVDAGALGLVLIFEGFITAVFGGNIPKNIRSKTIDEDLLPFLKLNLDVCNVEPEYEVQFRIGSSEKSLDFIKAGLKNEGNCLLIIPDESSAEFKIHIHCSDPETLIKKLKNLTGSFKEISIQAMHEQYQDLTERVLNKMIGVSNK